MQSRARFFKLVCARPYRQREKRRTARLARERIAQQKTNFIKVDCSTESLAIIFRRDAWNFCVAIV
jgi:hypothetical protein